MCNINSLPSENKEFIIIIIIIAYGPVKLKKKGLTKYRINYPMILKLHILAS